MSRGLRIPHAAMAAALLLSAGCTVGPDFQKPAAPHVNGYTPSPLATTTSTPDIAGGEAQHFSEGMNISEEWWQLFHSPALDALIKRSLSRNPSLKAAQAALTVAREAMLAQEGAYYPMVTGSLAASRQKTSAELSPATNSSALYFNLYTPQLNISYDPDVFGLNKRTVESLNAQSEGARFALIATQITLTSNIVAAAVQEASLRAQIDATRELISQNTDILRILRNQYARGYARILDVLAQETQLAQISATLPPLLKQLALQRDLLADLSGGYPSEEMPETFTLSSLSLPTELPVSLPSRLVEQRPDIRQAEENLHSASAQIGVAIANRLPNITLSASAGTAALTPSQIFSGSAGFWAFGANLAAPLFDGNALLHKERAAKAAYEQAAGQYQSTVLAAFQNVADTLTAIKHDADALKSAANAADRAKKTLDITKGQMEAGYVNNTAFLNAEIAYQQTLISLVQAQNNRYADTAALFQALGGGWWNDAGGMAENSAPPNLSR